MDVACARDAARRLRQQAEVAAGLGNAVLAAIRGHHERMDGTGYPDGLSGEKIPLLARILAILDCFDALTTSRAYRPALPTHDVLAFLESHAGSHFDPALVRAFLRIAPELAN